MCRLLPASTIGEAVYGDEMSDFECLTTQPGCQQMCYNQFSPMTHTRFWSMHVSLRACKQLPGILNFLTGIINWEHLSCRLVLN